MDVLLAGKDLGDARGRVGVHLGPARRRKSARICADRLGGHDLVGVEVEEPVVAALLLGEALLGAVAGEIVVDHPRACGLRDRLRAVGRARIDHDDVVGEAGDRIQRRADPVGLVLDDEEDREG